MNEIKRIHLGRQPFEIAIDAHKLLQAYLHDIKAAVGDSHKEVLEEVELRMAELLLERGITDEKTVIASDVNYLKQQLGEPGDFRTDDDETTPPTVSESTDTPKRLFRDTHDALVAGVSSGLGAYFGVPAPFVRLAFVALTLLWGWGILLYFILWVVIPEAKTSSERLQMQGKPVTVESLKEMVDEADVKGAANRVGGVIRPFVRLFGKLVLISVGAGFVAFGILGLITTMVGGVYTVLYHENIFAFGDFAISVRDGIFAASLILATALVSVATILAGIAIVRRTWTVPSWVTAAGLAGFFISTVMAVTLAPGVIDKGRQYADDIKNRQVVQVGSFQNVRIISDSQQDLMPIRYEYVADASSPADYRIQYDFNGHPQLKDVKYAIETDTLTLNTQDFVNSPDCKGFCFIDSYELKATIHGPALNSIVMEGESGTLDIPDGVQQPSLNVTVNRGNGIGIAGTTADKLTINATEGSGVTTTQLVNLQRKASISSSLSINDYMVSVPLVKEVVVQTDRTCSIPNSDFDEGFSANPFVALDRMPELGVTVNDATAQTARELRQRQDDAKADDPIHCVAVSSYPSY